MHLLLIPTTTYTTHLPHSLLLGLAADGNPVLVFRSALHQSNVDVGFFTRFVVWQLEKGKRLYGVGLQRQLYIVMDRSPSKTAAPMLGRYQPCRYFNPKSFHS